MLILPRARERTITLNRALQANPDTKKQRDENDTPPLQTSPGKVDIDIFRVAQSDRQPKGLNRCLITGFPAIMPFQDEKNFHTLDSIKAAS